MGLILNQKIKKLQKGYPTRTAKEQVEGGVLGGTEELVPGQLVKFGVQAGEYLPVNTSNTIAADASNVAGIALATNVKLVNKYPGESKDAPFCPGEAINLMVSGYIAVALTGLSATTISGTIPTEAEKATAEAAVKAAVAEGTAVECNNTGAFGASGITLNAVYTGIYEVVGSSVENTGSTDTPTYTYKLDVLADIKYNM